MKNIRKIPSNMRIFWLIIFLSLLSFSSGIDLPSIVDSLRSTAHNKRKEKNVPNSVRSTTATHSTDSSNRPNVIVMLADDLGYADTSVAPFTGNGISTPELERMAARGMVLTNFHTAAATCTPTRASILTGLYPWRLGIKAVFEYGQKGKRNAPKVSNRDDFLPHIPTLAMALRDANYSTGHSGKWHLGGMRNDDLDLRKLPTLTKLDPRRGKEGGSGQRCPHPGPNQQGFETYVSVLDGPGAPRQNELQVNDELYTKGCSALLKNDVEIGRQGGGDSELLSDCEVRHAIDMMKDAVGEKKPFYQQVGTYFHTSLHTPIPYLTPYTGTGMVPRTTRSMGRSTGIRVPSAGRLYRYTISIP